MNADSIPAFVDKWVTPTTILAIVGGIIWGVQLNAAVLSLTDQVARNGVDVKRAGDINEQQTIALTRATQVLADIQRRLEKAEDHVITHERDAEQWKRRILSNENHIERLSK